MDIFAAHSHITCSVLQSEMPVSNMHHLTASKRISKLSLPFLLMSTYGLSFNFNY